MAGRVQIVQSDGIGKSLDREPVTTGRLVDDPEQIQTDLVRRGTRQNLPANNLGLLGAPLLISPFCVGRQIGDVGWRGNRQRSCHAQRRPYALFGSYQSATDRFIFERATLSG